MNGQAGPNPDATRSVPQARVSSAPRHGLRVAIMQPTYLPWVGYFGLMASVDLFVLLDSVQFAKRSWQQRNQIKTPSGPQWLSVPVSSKGRRDQLIYEVQVDLARDFHQSHLKALELNYRRAPCFAQVFPLLQQSLSEPPSLLAGLNIRLMERMREVLDIRTPMLRSSAMAARGENAGLLANICVEVGAAEYVSPPGSKVYLEESDAFSRLGVPVRYFQFQCLPYRQQHGEFIPYMSAVDLLLNCGAGGREVIEGGIVTDYDQ